MRAGYRGCASASRGRSQPVARIAAKVNAAATFLVDPGGRGDSGSGDVAVHLGGHDPRRAPSADALLSNAAPGFHSTDPAEGVGGVRAAERQGREKHGVSGRERQWVRGRCRAPGGT